MLSRRIPEATKATIRALKATKDLTLEEIVQRCKVSRTSAHQLTSAEGREPEKISPEQEALILGSTEELRDQEGSFLSQRLIEQTGISQVSDRTVRKLKWLLLSAGTQKRTHEPIRQRHESHLLEGCKQITPWIYGKIHRFLLGWHLVCIQDKPHGPSPHSQRKSVEKKIPRSYKGVPS